MNITLRLHQLRERVAAMCATGRAPALALAVAVLIAMPPAALLAPGASLAAAKASPKAAPPATSADAAKNLEAAQAALNKGDYARVISLLDPLAEAGNAEAL